MHAMEIVKKQEREVSDELKKEREAKAKLQEDDAKRYEEKLRQATEEARLKIAELEGFTATHKEKAEVLNKLLAIKESEVTELRQEAAEKSFLIDQLQREQLVALSSPAGTMTATLSADEVPTPITPIRSLPLRWAVAAYGLDSHHHALRDRGIGCRTKL
jgi:hypothetical protein